MKVKENKKLISGSLDWLPFVGEWLSKKLGWGEYLVEFVVYVGEDGENGEIHLRPWEPFEDDGEKNKVVGKALKRLLLKGVQKDTGAIKEEGHTFSYVKELDQWTN